jgi:hypothetical protein
MPRATDRILDSESLGQRTAIVRAHRTDREDIRPASRDEHRLSIRVSGEHAAVGNVRQLEAAREVGASQRRGRVAHVVRWVPNDRGAEPLGTGRRLRLSVLVDTVLQSLEVLDEIALLLITEREIAYTIVVFHDVGERRRATIVKVRGVLP